MKKQTRVEEYKQAFSLSYFNLSVDKQSKERRSRCLMALNKQALIFMRSPFVWDYGLIFAEI